MYISRAIDSVGKVGIVAEVASTDKAMSDLVMIPGAQPSTADQAEVCGRPHPRMCRAGTAPTGGLPKVTATSRSRRRPMTRGKDGMKGWEKKDI